MGAYLRQIKTEYVEGGEGRGGGEGYRPYIFSRASLISPTVARARAAVIASSSKLPFPLFAASVRADRALETVSALREVLIFWIRAICAFRTAALSIARTSMGSVVGGLYLFTPTIAGKENERKNN